MKRFAPIGLALFVALACAACGGASKSAAAKNSAADPLLKQIKAEIKKQAVITGASSARTVEIYGPASHHVIVSASGGSAYDRPHVAGPWYLIVLRGHFSENVPVPPGASAPVGKIAMEVWSPTGQAREYSFPKRVPASVSRLGDPASISLS